MKPRKLKVAICIDPIGCLGKTSDEEEIEIKKDFQRILKPHEINFYRVQSAYPGEFKSGTDLILFDYGGVGFGNDLTERNSQYLIQYCLDNPNTLALIISSYTWNVYVKNIIRDFQYNELPNLQVVDWLKDDEEIIPKWFMQGLNSPKAVKGNICQLCGTDLDETSRKDKTLEQCKLCNKWYCNLCRWEKGAKGFDFICEDCGQKHD